MKLRLASLLAAAMLLVSIPFGCGGGDDATDSTPGPDATVGEDATISDSSSAQDSSLQDLSPEQVSAGDLIPPEDIPPFELPEPLGNRELGEECAQDGDCVSGLCWATTSASGCTIPCSSQGDCQSLGNMVCAPVRFGVFACVPPPALPETCESHEVCPYPTFCLDQYGWCELPECTLDADCPSGQECDQGVRQCQPLECTSTYECAGATQFCIDGHCGDPLCTSREDCGAEEICSYAQGICTDATPCNEEGACNMYNQVCVDGLCEPNLCATPCSGLNEICNPRTGECGAPCTSNSNCPSGWACNTSVGACYENNPPVAVPSVDGLGPAVDVPYHSTLTLDGQGSYDPDGAALTYRWTWLSVSPWGWQQTGLQFCNEATCEVGPFNPGLYQAGLQVKDEAGAWSIQAVATIFVDAMGN